jgi:hypothetical protein
LRINVSPSIVTSVRTESRNINLSGRHAGATPEGDPFRLAFDADAGAMRYVRTLDVSPQIRDRWFAWRAHGRLVGVVQQHLDARIRLEGGHGVELCDRLLEALDAEFARLLRGNPAAPVWTCSRHMSPSFWAGDEGTSLMYRDARRVVEKSIERYGLWGPVNAERLHDWNNSTIRATGRCFATAEAYCVVLATRRRVAKGQTAEITGHAPIQVEYEENDLDRLIRVRDRRVLASLNPLGRMGSLAPKISYPLRVRSPTLVVAKYADPAELRADVIAGRASSVVESSYGHQILQVDVISNWANDPGYADLTAAHAPYDHLAKRDLGYTVVDLVAVHSLVTRAMFPSFDSDDPIPMELELCGYGLLDLGRVDFGAARAVADDLGLSGAEHVTPATAEAAFRSLSKSQLETDARRLERRPYWVLGDQILVDFVAVDLEYHMVDFLAAETEYESRNPFDFEKRVHALLGLHGEQPLRAGFRAKLNGQLITDIDASVVVGDVLVVVDCFASPWRESLDLGDYSSTRNRVSGLLEKLSRWDQKWRRIAAAPPRWLLGTGSSRLLPVVVTPSPEWISSDASTVWFDEETPRICTVDELVEVLRHPGKFESHLLRCARCRGPDRQGGERLREGSALHAHPGRLTFHHVGVSGRAVSRPELPNYPRR